MKAGRRSPPHPTPLPIGEKETSAERLASKGMPKSSRTPLHAGKIAIRPATAADTAFILSLVPRFVSFDLPPGRRKRETLAAIRAEIERALREAPPSDCFFIAGNSRGTRTGFLHLQVQRDFFSGARTCHIADLAVAKPHDGQGIGGAMLAHAQAWATTHRCKQLTLSVFPGNHRARGLYERTGFAPDLLRMSRPLDRKG